MFDAHEVEIDLEWVDSDTCLMIVLTPVGRIEIIGTVWIEDETLFIDEAHIDGPGRGTISRHGLKRYWKQGARGRGCQKNLHSGRHSH
ncbi:MAG: hypothetical protein WAL14_05275, partial [Pseudolabrys sp.]